MLNERDERNAVRVLRRTATAAIVVRSKILSSGVDASENPWLEPVTFVSIIIIHIQAQTAPRLVCNNELFVFALAVILIVVVVCTKWGRWWGWLALVPLDLVPRRHDGFK